MAKIERVYSDSFNCLRNENCLLGIDEAGRGPVLGPMVYGLFCCRFDKADSFLKSEFGVADSKTLDEKTRDGIFAKFRESSTNNTESSAGDSIVEDGQRWFGYALDVISPEYISQCMLSPQKISLNEISHNSAISLIQSALDQGLIVDGVFVDTVGSPEAYKQKLELKFPNLNITVEKKADDSFPVVSAASICAKVTRDERVKNWKFENNFAHLNSVPTGSGYPSDPATKTFLRKAFDPIFGFPRMVRQSWQTAEEILDKFGIGMAWPDPENQSSYDAKGAGRNRKRKNRSLLEFCVDENCETAPVSKHVFFAERNLTQVVDFR